MLWQDHFDPEMKLVAYAQVFSVLLKTWSLLCFLSLDPNDQKSLEGMQKMEKEESPTEATADEDVDDMEGSGEEGDLEGSDSEAAQWADQEQWFGMQWPSETGPDKVPPGEIHLLIDPVSQALTPNT